MNCLCVEESEGALVIDVWFYKKAHLGRGEEERRKGGREEVRDAFSILIYAYINNMQIIVNNIYSK